MLEFIESPPFIMGLRIFTLAICVTILGYGLPTLRCKYQEKNLELSDVLVVVVALYWAVYHVYILTTYGSAVPEFQWYLFNARFSRLLNLSVMLSLVKDKWGWTQVWYSLRATVRRNGNGEENKSDE